VGQSDEEEEEEEDDEEEEEEEAEEDDEEEEDTIEVQFVKKMFFINIVFIRFKGRGNIVRICHQKVTSE
jgi:CO dehydrogenase/acetyl-CoA synthase beta subunit